MFALSYYENKAQKMAKALRLLYFYSMTCPLLGIWREIYAKFPSDFFGVEEKDFADENKVNGILKRLSLDEVEEIENILKYYHMI